MKDAKSWFKRILFKTSLLILLAFAIIFISDILEERKSKQENFEINPDSYIQRSRSYIDTLKIDSIKWDGQ